MKFDSKVSFKVKSKNQGNYVQISSKDFALLLLKDTHLGMHRKESFAHEPWLYIYCITLPIFKIVPSVLDPP